MCRATAGTAGSSSPGKGLPDGIWGKVGVAVAPSDGRRVYALIEAEKGGLFRSDDGGETWKLASGHHTLRQRAWYYTTLTIHPREPGRGVVPPGAAAQDASTAARPSARSGAPTMATTTTCGSIPRTRRGSSTATTEGWTSRANGGETLVRPAAADRASSITCRRDNANPYHVMGRDAGPGHRLGDRATACERKAFGWRDWQSVGGGEAGHVRSPSRTTRTSSTPASTADTSSRYDLRTKQPRNVSAPTRTNGSGQGGEDLQYRFQWTAPIAISPHEPNVDLSRRQRAVPYRRCRTDLDRHQPRPHPKRQDQAALVGRADHRRQHRASRSTAPSSPSRSRPRQQGLIWVGSDDGLVHVTRDGGQDLDQRDQEHARPSRVGHRRA